MTSSDEVVVDLSARADRAGVLLDVDGTLAPIVPHPDLSRVLPEVPSILARLATRLRLVAAISGRPADEVRRLVDVDGMEIVGTHGLEEEEAIAPEILREIDQLAAAVGAWVERKGPAVAVHFRGLSDPEAAATTAARGLAAVAAASGLELVPGKAILELMPLGAPRKGDAVETLVRRHRLEAVLFAGDDVGDLDAFAALGRLRADGLWTCGVVAAAPETAPQVLAAANLVVEGPGGVVALLSALADAMG